MGTLYVKFAATEETSAYTKQLDNVVDAGIAGDFIAIRYGDGVVSFTKHVGVIDEFQFEPDTDIPEAADSGESTDDTPSQ